MSELISLSCPYCHRKLEIPKDVDQITCAYCNEESIVCKTGSIFALLKLNPNGIAQPVMTSGNQVPIQAPPPVVLPTAPQVATQTTPQAATQIDEQSPDILTLSCPDCGGKLIQTSDADRFVCQDCKTESIIKREGGVIFAKAITEHLSKASVSVEVETATYAIPRLETELQETIGGEQGEKINLDYLRNEYEYARQEIESKSQHKKVIPIISLSLFFAFILFIFLWIWRSYMPSSSNALANLIQVVGVVVFAIALFWVLPNLWIKYRKAKVLTSRPLDEINVSIENQKKIVRQYEEKVHKLEMQLQNYREILSKF
jgi:hypothetical protein